MAEKSRFPDSTDAGPTPRREHLIELQHLYGFQPFTSRKYREIAQGLMAPKNKKRPIAMNPGVLNPKANPDPCELLFGIC